LMATDSSGNSRTATYSSLPGGMASFNGHSANTSVVALPVSENGTVLATQNSTEYDFPMNRTLPGVLAARGSPCRLLLWCWGRTRNPSLSH
jgi:hypothetical protein